MIKTKINVGIVGTVPHRKVSNNFSFQEVELNHSLPIACASCLVTFF